MVTVAVTAVAGVADKIVLNRRKIWGGVWGVVKRFASVSHSKLSLT